MGCPDNPKVETDSTVMDDQLSNKEKKPGESIHQDKKNILLIFQKIPCGHLDQYTFPKTSLRKIRCL